jgi:hypothetical protein
MLSPTSDALGVQEHVDEFPCHGAFRPTPSRWQMPAVPRYARFCGTYEGPPDRVSSRQG